MYLHKRLMAFALLFLLLTGNCATIIDVHYSMHDAETPRLYGGVRSTIDLSNSPQGAMAGYGIILLWLDLPFSFVADTVLFIPWLIWNGVDQLI